MLTLRQWSLPCRRYDESIDAFTAAGGGGLDMMELGRKVASERELLRSPAVRRENALFDESSNFLLWAPRLPRPRREWLLFPWLPRGAQRAPSTRRLTGCVDVGVA